MRTRTPLALFSAVGLSWALGGSVVQAQTQEQSFGSVVPCAVPLRWRIADVDPRFALSPSVVEAAVEEAMALWEGAMGRRLFEPDPAEGFPVRFEFDDRQAMLQLRARFQGELDRADQGLAARAAELQGINERFEAVRAEYEDRVAQLQRRTEEHNADVLLWNQRGGAPPLVRSELLRAEQILTVERASLDRAERDLRETFDRIRSETERLNRGIEGRNQQASALQSELPTRATESGRYNETVLTRDGEVISIEREIVVFRFADRTELVLVVAHELGHALGLGHATSPGAAMSEEVGGGDPNRSAITSEDVEMLRARCPRL